MSDKKYSQGEEAERKPAPETRVFMGVVGEKLDVIHETTIRTEKHVKVTNGKVAENTRWRNYLFAAVIMISFLFPTLTGVFVYFMADMRDDVSQMITIEVQKNRIEIEKNKIDYSKIEAYIDDKYIIEEID